MTDTVGVREGQDSGVTETTKVLIGHYSKRDMKEEELFGIGVGKWSGCVWR